MFHTVTECFPQDAMHVLLEGVVPHEFTLFLRYALDKKYFTLSELNSQIEHFHYNYHEIKDKPSPIQKEAIQGTKKIGQYACQMWLLAILLPVLIASTIPVSDPNWICFGTLLKILAICMCRKIDHRMIPILTELKIIMSNRPVARKAQGISLCLITCDVVTGCRVKCIAVQGEIATARFQSLARRAQYRIFLFRERSVILKSSVCLPVLVRSRSDERSRSYSSEKVGK